MKRDPFGATRARIHAREDKLWKRYHSKPADVLLSRVAPHRWQIMAERNMRKKLEHIQARRAERHPSRVD